MIMLVITLVVDCYFSFLNWLFIELLNFFFINLVLDGMVLKVRGSQVIILLIFHIFFNLFVGKDVYLYRWSLLWWLFGLLFNNIGFFLFLQCDWTLHRRMECFIIIFVVGSMIVCCFFYRTNFLWLIKVRIYKGRGVNWCSVRWF